MADNTDEKHLDNPTKTQSENPSDEIIPTKDTEPIKPNQIIETMEVHKHPIFDAFSCRISWFRCGKYKRSLC